METFLGLKSASIFGSRLFFAVSAVGLLGQVLIDGDSHALSLGVVTAIVIALLSAAVTVIGLVWWLASYLQELKSDVAHIKENCPRCVPHGPSKS